MKKLVAVRALVACLVALLVVSCGGEGGDEEPTTTPAADVENTTTTAAEDSEGASGDLGELSTVCLEATEAMAEAAASYSTGLSQAFTGSLDDESLQVAADQLQAMTDAAPEEIKDDFRMIADAMAAFYAAFGEIGYEPGATPSPEQAEQLAELAETFDNDAFNEASLNIEGWFEENC